MKRLTFDGLFCDIAMCQEVPCKYPDTGCSQRQVWERLKEFEDLGLAPEEIKSKLEMLDTYRKYGMEPHDYRSMKEAFAAEERAKNQLSDLINTMFGENAPSKERICEIVKAYRDGRCMILPVKVGDTINAFRFTEERGLYVVSDVVTSVTTNRNGYTVRTKKHFYPIKQSDLYVFAPISEYPKAMADFYIGTKETAEKVLEDMNA